ncbi:PDR/VanB family oxidoreductase [Thiosocius teredinicola]|uniref:PDR/VanB family oxidoreductase n=1 Tax=Thiosocius teredinicola TaxID=1973002 RepID=UPI000990EB73
MQVDQLKVKITAINEVAPTIREFCLVPVDGELLPFSPGSHVVVEMDGGEKTYKNAYSLLSDPRDVSAYRIAVRLQDASRGGSKFMHEQVTVGDELKISTPANLFAPHWPAKKHVLIAGGVGITPFMAYLPELERRGADFELHYLYRSSQTGAYRELLSKRLGGRYFDYDSLGGSRCDAVEVLSNRNLGTHFYVCGPESLLSTVQQVAADLGIPDSAIHYETFAAPKPGEPFEAEISETGQVIPVGAEESLLEALEAAGVEVPNLCRGGVCGQCQCKVVSGDIEHRDNFLSAQDKAAGQSIMPCVSRSKSPRLVLDI